MFGIKDSNKEKGITLVEIIVVIFVMAIFFMIVVADFPKIFRQSSLSRVTYKFAQDLRRAEDLGLSGVTIKNGQQPQPQDITTIKGYGIFINTSVQPTTQYLIYADVNNSKTYDSPSISFCDKISATKPSDDCIIELVDVSQENKSLSIKTIKTADDEDILGSFLSINFTPPGPKVTIKDEFQSFENTKIGIVFKNTDNVTRTVWVNTAGLIDVQYQ